MAKKYSNVDRVLQRINSEEGVPRRDTTTNGLIAVKDKTYSNVERVLGNMGVETPKSYIPTADYKGVLPEPEPVTHKGGHDIAREIVDDLPQRRAVERVKRSGSLGQTIKDILFSPPDTIGWNAYDIGKSTVEKTIDRIREYRDAREQIKSGNITPTEADYSYTPLTDLYAKRREEDLKKQREDLITQIKVANKKIEAQRREAYNPINVAAYKLSKEAKDETLRNETAAAVSDIYGKYEELQQKRLDLLDQLHAIGGKYGILDLAEDIGNMVFSNAGLSDIDILGYQLDRALGLVDPNDQRAYDQAHALQQDRAAQLAAAQSGRGWLGQHVMQGIGAAGDMFSRNAIYQATGIPNALQNVAAAPAAAMAEYDPHLLNPTLGQNVAAGATRFAGNALSDVVANPTNFAISFSSGLNKYDEAKTAGASDSQAFAAAIGSAVLEYFSNKMFSGTPLEDNPAEQGYIVEDITEFTRRLAKKTGKNIDGVAQKFFNNSLMSYVFDKSGEGMEEVITRVFEPWVARLTYDPDADLATLDDLWEEWLGGVFMSVVSGVAEPVTNFSARKAAERAENALQYAFDAGQRGLDVEKVIADMQKGRAEVDAEDLRKAYQAGASRLQQVAKFYGVETEGKSAKEVRAEVEYRYKTLQDMSPDDLQNMASRATDFRTMARFTMGPNGYQLADSYMNWKSHDTDYADYYNEAYDVYEMGREGAKNTFQGKLIDQEEAEKWYRAGQEDARLEEQNGQRYQQGQSGNAGEGRVDGLDSAQQRDGMAEGPELATQPGVAEGDAGAGSAAEKAAADSNKVTRQQAVKKLVAGLKRISPVEAGLTNGTRAKTMRMIDESTRDQWHPDMIAAEQKAAEDGVKVKFYYGYMGLDDGKGAFFARGLNEGDGGTIWIRADASEDLVSLVEHELYHTEEKRDPELDEKVRQAIIEQADGQERLNALVQKYAENYRGSGMTDEQILREIFADANGKIDIFAHITPKDDSVTETARATDFTETVRRVVAENKKTPRPGQTEGNVNMASREESDLPAGVQRTLDKYNATVQDGVVVNDSIAPIMASPEYRKPVSVSDLADMASHDTMPEWAQKYMNGGGDAETLAAIQQFDDLIWKDMGDGFTDAQKLLQALVPSGTVITDKYGPLRTNVEYRRSFDMDTSCPRTFQFTAYRNAIMKRLNRTLTFEESINLINLMSAYHQMIPCTYCYVENKRILKAAYYNNFYKFHNDVLNGIKNGLTIEDLRPQMYGWNAEKGKLTDAAEKTLKAWMDDKSGYNPTIAENYHTVNLIRNAAMHLLDGMMADGKITANTSVNSLTNIIAKEYGLKSKGAMTEAKKMAADWRYDAGRNTEHMYLVQDTGEEFDKKIADRALELDNEAINYSNAASSAKTVDNYAPYGGELENISKEDRDYIMGMGGIRKHSSNDFRIDYVLDYFQFYADLAKGKWRGHTYTKNGDYVRIFGRTGDMINMSIAFNDTADGVTENVSEGMEHKLAKELREAFPNAGVMAMVTSDKQLSYALNADWVDMIIPFHNSGLPKAIWYNMKAWADYTSVQSESLYNADDMKAALQSRGVDTKGMSAEEVSNTFYETFGVEKAVDTKTGKQFAPHFYPYETTQHGVKIPGHNNSKAKYMELCRQYGVHPRFDGVQVQDADGNTINVVDHPNYMKLVKETSRATENFDQPTIEFNFNKADPYLTEKYGKEYGKKSVTPMDYAMARLNEEAKNGGYQNAANDPMGIVDEFIRDYAGKGREIGWLSERAEMTKDALDNAQDKLVDETRKQTLEEFKKTEGEKPKPRERSNFYADEPAQRNMASIDQKYTSRYDKWVADGKPGGTYINIGVTPDWLVDIGMAPKRYSWDTSKIIKMQKDHPYMTDDLMKQVPNVVEHPVIALESKTQPNSVIFYGEVYTQDEDGNPVPALAAVQLLPERHGYVLDEYKVASAYAKDVERNGETTGEKEYIPDTEKTQRFIDSSEILYIDPDKNRTQNWLRLTRLQLPFMPDQYGFINKVSLFGRDVNGKFSSGDTSADTPMKNALSGIKFDKNGNMASREEDIGDSKVYNRTVVLKEDTVDKYLQDYASKGTPKYAQAYIAYMSPDAFLKLTTTPAGRGQVSRETGPLDLENLKSATVEQPFQLRIDHESGEVLGHEGRHRATALYRANIDKIPVLLFDSSNKYSKASIESLKLTGQFDDRASSTVTDVEPLSYGNRDVVLQKFATQPVLERMQEKHNGRETVRYSREPAQAKRDAGKKLTENEFYSLYSAHKLDLRNQGNIQEQIASIMRDGFKGDAGFGHNLMPTRQTVKNPTMDKYNVFLELEKEGRMPAGTAEEYKKEVGDDFGKLIPGNLSVAKYGPRKGETILLVPKSGAEITKNYDRVKPGYKPQFDYEFVTADYDYQPYYEMYSKAYDAQHGNMASRETDNRLQEENIALQRRLDAALGETKLTTAWRAAAKDVQRVAANIIDATSSKESSSIVEQKIRSLVEAASNGGITSAEMKDLALDIARGLLKRSSVLTSPDSTTYDGMRKYLKSIYINVPMEMRKQMTDWKAFAAAHKAMRMKTDGVAISTVYDELRQRLGEDYFPKLTDDMDKLQQIAEILDNLTPIYDNPYSVNMAEATEETANGILEAILDIGQAEPTYADRAKAREGEVRSLYQQKLAEQKESLQQRIQQEADRRREEVEAIKQTYRDMNEKRRNRKQESADRQKLLRVAKRLQNRKLDSVHRAIVDSLVGDLDTVSVHLTNKSLTNLYELRKWYESFADDPNFLSIPQVEEKLKRLEKRHIGDMTLDEVRDLTDVLRSIEVSLANYGKMIRTEDRRLVSEMSQQSQENIRNTKGSKKGLANWLVTNTLAPERLARRLTGYNDNDPLYMRMKELSEGQRKMFDYQMRAEALFSKWTNDKKLIERLRDKDTVTIRGFVDGKETTAEITPDMRMALYLHSLNDQNLKHIANGGVTIPNIEEYRKGNLQEAYARGVTMKLSPDMVRGIANGMSAEERAFANAAHRYFNGMSRDEINAVSEALLGYSIAGVENYFPIQTDDAFTQKEIDAIQNDGTIQGMGFTKERINASNAIYLVPMTDVLNRSIANHSKYVGMAIPVANMNKLWMANTKDDATDSTHGLKEAMRSKWGAGAKEAIDKILTDVQNPHRSTDEFSKALAKVRSNYAGAVLTLNGSVALKQAASYPTAAAVLGWEPLAKAMGNFGKVDLDLIAKYTPLQWYRSKGFSTQELGDIRNRGGLMDKVMSAHITTKDGREIPFLNWIQGVDLATTRKLWKASEYYVQANQKNLKVGSDDYYKAVAEIYNQVIEETQPNYTTMQRPQLLRTDNQLAQTMVMFKTQPFQNFNILYDAIGELRAAERLAKNGDNSKLAQAKKNAFNAVTSNLASAAVFAAMTMAWALARRKKEKYEDKEGNFNPWMQLGKDVLSSEFGMLPFGSDAYELIASMAFGDKYYGMSNITADSLSGALESTLNAFNALKDALASVIDGDDKTSVDPEKLARKLFSTAQDASKLCGIPLDNVVNLMSAIYSNVASGLNGEYVTAYEMLRLTKGLSSSANKSAAYDILYKAHEQNPAQYNELRRMMIDDGFKDANIDKAMKKRSEKK